MVLLHFKYSGWPLLTLQWCYWQACSFELQCWQRLIPLTTSFFWHKSHHSEVSFGIKSTLFEWIKSYMTGRVELVRRGSTSDLDWKWRIAWITTMVHSGPLLFIHCWPDRHHQATSSTASLVCWWCYDSGLLSPRIRRLALVYLVSLSGQSILAEHCDDVDPLVCDNLSTRPSAICHHPSGRRWRAAFNNCSWLMHLYWQRRRCAITHDTHCSVRMFSGALTALQH